QDSYSYDSLNRLGSVSEVHGGNGWQSGQDFIQSYAYDRYGNRTIDQAHTQNTFNPNFAVDPTTNRLTVPAGYNGTMGYDNAGNLVNDTYTGGGVRAYDAEDRMTQADNGADVYTYDADGHRVKRKIGSTETWQVYGVGGESIAEYAANGDPAHPQKEYGYRN